MRHTLVELSFLDKEGRVRFDYEDNILFYGFNGKGKTRVLKTFFLLHKLAQEDRLNRFYEIFQSLNLKSLNINSNKLEELFSDNREYSRRRDETFVNFVRDEHTAFNFLQNRIRKLFEMYEFELSPMDKIRYRRITDILSKLLILSESKLKVQKLDYMDFEKFISDTRMLTNKIRNFNHGIERLSSDEIDGSIMETVDVCNYLRSNFLKISGDYSSDLAEQRAKMIDHRKEISLYFKSKSIRYISTELSDNMIVFNNIKDLIQSINQNLIRQVWINKAEVVLSNEHTVLMEKFDLLNNIINRYEDIKISVNENGELMFTKKGDNVDFDKLSSGEKRIIIIFLNLILFDYSTLLIDEPEISLSLNYQSKIINDLMRYKGDKNLMIATHAPFIFEDFKQYENNKLIEV